MKKNETRRNETSECNMRIKGLIMFMCGLATCLMTSCQFNVHKGDDLVYKYVALSFYAEQAPTDGAAAREVADVRAVLRENYPYLFENSGRDSAIGKVLSNAFSADTLVWQRQLSPYAFNACKAWERRKEKKNVVERVQVKQADAVSPKREPVTKRGQHASQKKENEKPKEDRKQQKEEKIWVENPLFD